MKRKRPVAVMDTWPVRADGLLPVEEKKKAFRSYGALSITNCQALSSGEVAEDYYFIFYFFPTCLSNEAEIGLHQDPLNFQSGFLKCNHRHTGNLDVSCCTEGQLRKKKNKSVATLQLLRCAWIKSSKREKKKEKKWNGKIQLPFENTSQSCNIKRQCVSAAFTAFDSGRGGVKTGLIKPVTAERAVAHSLVKEKGEETLLPPWVRVVLKMKSRRFCFAEGKKKKKTETEREDLHTWVHNSIKSTSDRL